MPRRILADEEGFVYWAKSASGYLYGPYSKRGTAAGILTSLNYYAPKPTKYDYRTGTYVPNPAYDPNRPKGEVVKSKLGEFVPAPKLSLREKYNLALAKLERIEQMLNDRGIDIQFD